MWLQGSRSAPVRVCRRTVAKKIQKLQESLLEHFGRSPPYNPLTNEWLCAPLATKHFAPRSAKS